MGLYSELQSVSGGELFEAFLDVVPPPGTSDEDMEAATIPHLAKIEQVLPLLEYVHSFGNWTLQQVAEGEIDIRDAQMMLMGAMGTAAALASYALNEETDPDPPQS